MAAKSSENVECKVVRVSPEDNLFPLSPVREIRVGADTKTRSFHVHESLLTSRSDFFKSLTTERWRDILENSENDPDIFGLYVTLIYTGKVATKGANEWKKLWQLYVLSETLVDTQAQKETRAAMQAFIRDFVHKRPMFSYQREEPPICEASLDEIYTKTTKEDPIRRLVVEFYVNHGRYSWVRIQRDELPYDFMYEVIEETMRRKEGLPIGFNAFDTDQQAFKSSLPTSTPSKADPQPDSATKDSPSSKSTTTKEKNDAESTKEKSKGQSPIILWPSSDSIKMEADRTARNTSPFRSLFSHDTGNGNSKPGTASLFGKPSQSGQPSLFGKPSKTPPRPEQKPLFG